MARRSRSSPLPEPASLTNSLKICERCRLETLAVGAVLAAIANFCGLFHAQNYDGW
jgi:ubiquitin